MLPPNVAIEFKGDTVPHGGMVARVHGGPIRSGRSTEGERHVVGAHEGHGAVERARQHHGCQQHPHGVPSSSLAESEPSSVGPYVNNAVRKEVARVTAAPRATSPHKPSTRRRSPWSLSMCLLTQSPVPADAGGAARDWEPQALRATLRDFKRREGAVPVTVGGGRQASTLDAHPSLAMATAGVVDSDTALKSVFEEVVHGVQEVRPSPVVRATEPTWRESYPFATPPWCESIVIHL